MDEHSAHRASQTQPHGAQGVSRDNAIAKFCRVYGEAQTGARYALNFHGQQESAGSARRLF
jgi:hypothetical protein